MNSIEIESKILELVAEDAYGSWELWWDISADIDKNQKELIKKKFIETISNLIEANKLEVLHHKAMGAYEHASFDPKQLEFELENSSTPDPDSFYWFSLKL